MNNEETGSSSEQAVGTFSDLPLSPEIREAIEAIGYETPSPIQAEAIPYLAEGRDLLGVAQTGTGKTAAFALPLLSDLDTRAGGPQILCLAPTRELAIQVAEAFETFGQRMKNFRSLSIYGGDEYRRQIKGLREGAHVVVGTPGRMMDHLRKGTLKTDKIKALILDEADEMLSMGFIEDVEWILEQMPEERQTALFSATMPSQIKKLADKYLKDPAEITIRVKATTASNTRQRFIQRRNPEKTDTLIRILEVEDFDAVLVFSRTKNATSVIAESLQGKGYAAEALNGDMPQNLREKTLARVKNGKIDILVATDVAARGLDVDRISHVINYDAPFDVESYIHRIGRTGRAGRQGDAIIFINGRENRILKAIERTVRSKLEKYTFPSTKELNERKIQRLFARLDETLAKDLSDYKEVLEKYLEEKDADPLSIAAAMAFLESGNQPFYLKAVPQPKQRDREWEDRGRRSDGPRGKSRFQSGDLSMQSFRLEVGESHGVGKGDIVGAIANEAGIEPKHMGKIRMFEEHSFIELPESMPKDAFQALRKIWVRGNKLDISKDDSRPIGKRKPRPFKKFAKKKKYFKKSSSRD